MPERGVPPALLGVYRRTPYVVDGVTIRIGRRSAAMDALLVRHKAACAVFVTAWNPFSRRMPEGWNRRMQARLRERLGRRVCLPAGGGLGRWREDHLLVLGEFAPVVRLARRFRQNAVVAIRRGGPARLVLLRAPGPVLWV